MSSVVLSRREPDLFPTIKEEATATLKTISRLNNHNINTSYLIPARNLSPAHIGTVYSHID
jgi:hypothetical protein